MSVRSLDILVARAVLSDKFLAEILNGRRAELIRDSDLEPEEVVSVLAIKAGTLAEFAASIEEIIRSRESL